MYLEILSAIERDEDKMRLPERIDVNLRDSFAMGLYKELFQEATAGGMPRRNTRRWNKP
jgi:hypothetical protein